MKATLCVRRIAWAQTYLGEAAGRRRRLPPISPERLCSPSPLSLAIATACKRLRLCVCRIAWAQTHLGKVAVAVAHQHGMAEGVEALRTQQHKNMWIITLYIDIRSDQQVQQVENWKQHQQQY